MSEILRDPMWQFAAVLIALVSILISIIVYLKQRIRKSLSYKILSLNPLLSVKEEIKSDLQIMYRGEPVEQVHLIVAKIINTGNLPILSKEYERPISLSFGEEAQILTFEITEKEPDNLRPSAKIEEKRVVLTPILLNRGDSVTLKILVTKYKELKIAGRIAGVKEIQKVQEKHFRYIIVALVGILVEFSGFFVPSNFPIPGYLVVLAGVGLALYGVSRLRR